jgi:hypothetical protein
MTNNRFAAKYWHRIFCRIAMKMSGPAFLASIGLCLTGAARAADATSLVDLARRNTTLAPAGTVKPAVTSPDVDHAVQDRRIETNTIDKAAAAIGARRAAVDVREARDKNVQPMVGRKPEVIAMPLSSLNQRPGRISTAGDGRPPERVSRYQASLAAASASNMARFPASSGGTAATINRFVFRQNPPETPIATDGAPVIPAAGGSASRK